MNASAYYWAQLRQSWAKRDKDATFRLAPAVALIDRAVGPVLRGQPILSLGPRNGIELDLLEQAAWGEVEALDLFPHDSRIRRGDFHALPYATGRFGLVFASHVLEHSLDLRRVVREITRVLRPGGYLWVATPRGAAPNAHDPVSFAGPEAVVQAFAGADPQVVEDGSNEREIRLLLRLRRAGARRRLRVLLFLPDRFASRAWIDSGLVMRLGAAGHRVTAVMDVSGVPEQPGLKITPARGDETGPRWRRWLRRGPLRTMSYVHRAARGERTYQTKLALRHARRQRLEIALLRALGRVVDLERLACGIERWLPVSWVVRHIVRSMRLDLVVVWTSLYEGLEAELVKAARRAGVPSLGVIASFDTLTCKGAPLVRPDALSVWGDASQAHAVEHHGFASERVFVTGPTHWDVYGEPPTPILNRRWILVAGTTLAYHASERDLVRRLVEIAADLDLHVWYRPHPRLLYRRAIGFDGVPRLTVDTRGLDTRMADLRDLLANALCVVSAFSTLLAEAALVGTPALVVGFGSTTGGSEYDSRPKGRLLDHADYAHMAEVVSWPGVTVCRSEAELLAGLRALVRDGLDPEVRAVLRQRAERIARCLDGGARRRMVEAVEAVAAFRPVEVSRLSTRAPQSMPTGGGP